MITRIGKFCFRRRWWVLVTWLVVMVVGGASMGPLFSSLSANRPAQGMESNVARQVIMAEGTQYNQFFVVLDGADPQDAPSRDAIQRAAADVRAINGVQSVGDALRSADGSGALITVTLAKLDKSATKKTLQQATERMRGLATDIPGASVKIGGDEPLANETNKVSGADTTRAEQFSLPVTLLVLFFVLGGIVVATLPVLGAIVAITGSFAVVLAFSAFVPLDTTVLSIVILLGLGLSLDYGLLLVARYRDELLAGRSREQAVARTWATAGRTIMFSGLTVIAALSGLLMFDVPRLQTMGASGISATLVAMFSSLTLSSALFGFLGRWIKPSKRDVARARTGKALDEHGLFARLARRTQRRPLLVSVCTAVALLVITLPALTSVVKLPQLTGLPRSMESVQVAAQLESEYDIQQQPAVKVVARTDPATLDSWAARWSTDPVVARVEPAAQAGPNLSTVAIRVVGDTQSEEAQALVDRTRADRPPNVESWVMGDAAVLVDLVRKTEEGLPWAIGVMVLSMLVLLFLMTGSVLVPVKAVLMNVLSIGATFGALIAIFQYGWLSGPLHTLTNGGLSPYVFLIVLSFAFGFSMDYEVFLLGRIKEYVDGGQDTNTAVRHGLQRSGRIITSAALLMLIVFTGFGIGELSDVEQLGIGLFVAVAVDATIVRCLLVPATMTLLGDWNWWAPAPLRRLHAKFGLREHDGTAPPHRELAGMR